MINRQSPVPPFQQIAADLRSKILSGDLAPGSRLPAYGTLATQYGVGLGTVTRAMHQLRDTGLIESGTGEGTFVRERPAKQTVVLPSGALLDNRLPTPEERERHGLEPGVPVFEMTTLDGERRTFPGDRYRFTSR